MQFPGSIARACAAFALLAACGAGPASGAPAETAAPSLLWANARHLAVICLVQSNTMRDSGAMEKLLCARVRELAGRGAPFAVNEVGPGDRALIAPDTVTLLVHASIERSPGGRTLAFTIRPHRASDGEADILFGTPPRAVELPSGSLTQALDAALSEALSEILPWQRPTGLIARPL